MNIYMKSHNRNMIKFLFYCIDVLDIKPQINQPVDYYSLSVQYHGYKTLMGGCSNGSSRSRDCGWTLQWTDSRQDPVAAGICGKTVHEKLSDYGLLKLVMKIRLNSTNKVISKVTNHLLSNYCTVPYPSCQSLLFFLSTSTCKAFKGK
jgi:hypothetical protein